MSNTPLLLTKKTDSDILRAAYLQCKEPIKRTRLHLIWLMSKSKDAMAPAKAAAAVGRSVDWARKTMRTYNAMGIAGLTDKREKNGTQKILNERQQRSLKEVLAQKPSDKGLWTGPKVAAWMSKELGKNISAVTGWHYLLHAGYTLQVPRPRNRNAATPEEQAAFKKNSKRKSQHSEKSILKKP